MTLDLSLIDQTFDWPEFRYDWKTCVTYALGVGSGPDELCYVWEGSTCFRVIPSFAVVPTIPLVFDVLRRMRADFRTLVHGEESVCFHAPLAVSGCLRTTGKSTAVYDKGKGAVVIIETQTVDADGNRLFDTRCSVFCRGQGGFGGDRGSPTEMPAAAPETGWVLDRAMPTHPNQALLYRLSGDLNPLHADPVLAARAGFRAPILQGLATFGFATRAMVAGLCDGSPERLKRISARFSREVYPGETLRVRARPSTVDGLYLMQADVVGTEERVVLSHGIAEIQ